MKFQKVRIIDGGPNKSGFKFRIEKDGKISELDDITGYQIGRTVDNLQTVTVTFNAEVTLQQTEEIKTEERVYICGIDCKPADHNCNGYCKGESEKAKTYNVLV